MSSCPECHRPVAAARENCLYCGALLPSENRRPGRAADPDPTEARAARSALSSRVLLVLDFTGLDAGRLADATGASAYEAALLARRGGLHLHRVLEPDAARAEAARLVAAGVPTILVPEAEARTRPLRAIGGQRQEDTLLLRTEQGGIAIGPADLLLLVSGPILRERRSAPRRRAATGLSAVQRQPAPTRVDEGWRLHLHRRADPRPIEIDVEHFELGFAATGSARLELDGWVRAAAAAGVAWDDGFRRVPPALGPAEPDPAGAVSAFASLSQAARGGSSSPAAAATGSAGPPLALDNVAQFRFYSGWKAAVARQRAS